MKEKKKRTHGEIDKRDRVGLRVKASSSWGSQSDNSELSEFNNKSSTTLEDAEIVNTNMQNIKVGIRTKWCFFIWKTEIEFREVVRNIGQDDGGVEEKVVWSKS